MGPLPPLQDAAGTRLPPGNFSAGLALASQGRCCQTSRCAMVTSARRPPLLPCEFAQGEDCALCAQGPRFQRPALGRWALSEARWVTVRSALSSGAGFDEGDRDGARDALWRRAERGKKAPRTTCPSGPPSLQLRPPCFLRAWEDLGFGCVCEHRGRVPLQPGGVWLVVPGNHAFHVARPNSSGFRPDTEAGAWELGQSEVGPSFRSRRRCWASDIRPTRFPGT